MTVGTVSTRGTELFYVDNFTSSVAVIRKMSCPTGITGIGGPADQIDITCLSSVEREFAPGFQNPAALSVPFNFIPSAEDQQALFDLKQSGATVPWLIALSEGTAQPTLDSDDQIVPPAGRTSLAFDGYVADLNLDIATNEIVRGTLSIQRSGAVTPYFNAPAP